MHSAQLSFLMRSTKISPFVGENICIYQHIQLNITTNIIGGRPKFITAGFQLSTCTKVSLTTERKQAKHAETVRIPEGKERFHI